MFDKDTTKSLEIINNTPNEFKIMKKKTTKYLHAKNKNNVNMNNRNFCDRHVIYEKKSSPIALIYVLANLFYFVYERPVPSY